MGKLQDYVNELVERWSIMFKGVHYKQKLEALEDKVRQEGYVELWEIQKDISDKKAELDSVNKDYSYRKDRYDTLLNTYNVLDDIDVISKERDKEEKRLHELRTQLEEVEGIFDFKKVASELEDKVQKLKEATAYWQGIVLDEENGIFFRPEELMESSYYKEELKKNKARQAKMRKDKTATDAKQWVVEGSKTDGKKLTDSNIKQILRSFDSESATNLKTLTYKNYQSKLKSLKKSFDSLNKMNEIAGVSITRMYLKLKEEELDLSYKELVKKEEEKELLREQRELEREEQKALKEIEKNKKVVDKDIKHYENMMAELKLKLRASEDKNRQLEIENELQSLEEKKSEKEEEKEALDFRKANATAGYVYIISNIGSFGQEVFKIGVTRRLDPLERVKELGDASVPFKFDVHALIFSENAFDLETELHRKFKDRSVNMVNQRKEFFNVTIEELKEELAKHGDLAINFEEVPEALEYRESVKIKKEKVADVA